MTPASSPMKDVYFDFDRYDLSADARTILRANARWLEDEFRRSGGDRRTLRS